MYERFYNLRERPFSLSPDPDYLYLSRAHKEALSYLRFGIEGHAGFVVITGEIGCGKTTLLQTVLRGLDRQTSVARLVNTMLDPRELVEAVMLDFGLDPGQGRSKPHLLHDLARYLVDQRMAGRLALLVIDEAQNLTPRAVEELRMLSNFQLGEQALLQSFLIGQPELRTMMQGPQMQQLRQRVTASYHLGPLDKNETQAYIEHRLTHVGWKGDPRFEPATFDLIHVVTGGIPRRINTLCNRVMLAGFLGEKHAFDTSDIQAISREIREELGPEAKLAAVPSAIAREGANGHPGAGSSNESASWLAHCRDIEDRIERLEKTVGGAVDLLHRLLHRDQAAKPGKPVGR
jgi:general secretion pathway protein A